MTQSKWKRRTLQIGITILCITSAGVIGTSYGLLNYSLTPQTDNRNKALKWHEADSLYPGLRTWHDSLKTLGKWQDTTIFATDGTKLYAEYVKADHSQGKTAVLVHGYGDCNVDMMPIGRMYADKLGMNILLPDLRYAGKSEGNHIQMGWNDRLDIKQWVSTLPQLFGDSAKAVIHGVSMGAATTMMLSGETDIPAYVKGFVEDCGYTSVDEQFSKELYERFHLPRQPFIPIASTICRYKYGWTFKEASALEQVKKCKRPMLFIHGSADKFVPTRMVYPLYAAHSGPKELWITPGVEHARSYHDYPKEYLNKTKAFLEICLR